LKYESIITDLVIAHISGTPKQVMWERLDSRPRESSDRLPNGRLATEQDVRAIPVGSQAELAAQFTQPEDRFGRPAFHDVEDELGSHQDQSENTAHAFNGLDAQIFDIQALLLIKAIALFNPSA
jgi:hypothetical protein